MSSALALPADAALVRAPSSLCSGPSPASAAPRPVSRSPTGRLRSGIERGRVASGYATAVGLELVRVLLADMGRGTSSRSWTRRERRAR